MIFYLTFNDRVTGVYRSQVIDVVKFLNKNFGSNIKLVAFISIRDFFSERKKIKVLLPSAIVFPMFPRLTNWRFNILALGILSLIKRPEVIISRNVFAFNISLGIRKILKDVKLVYDGRGAANAEWNEYNVVKDPKLKMQGAKLEYNSVTLADFRIAVSNKLIDYWRTTYNLSDNNYIVVPCTLETHFKSLPKQVETLDLKSKLGYASDETVFIYSGSIAGWQSFDLMYNFFNVILNQENARLLFLSESSEFISKLELQFPGKVKRLKVDFDDVFKYLCIGDYGILIRENSITNEVASPVKFAEYLAAGLSLIISPHIGDYSEFVESNKCGIVIPSGLSKYNSISKSERLRNIKLSALFFKENYISQYSQLFNLKQKNN